MAGDNKNIKISIGGQDDLANLTKDIGALKNALNSLSEDAVKSLSKLSEVTNATISTIKELTRASGSISSEKLSSDFKFTEYADKNKSSAFLQKTSEENKARGLGVDRGTVDLSNTIKELSAEVKRLSQAISGKDGGQILPSAGGRGSGGAGGGGGDGGGPPTGDDGAGFGGGFFGRSSRAIRQYLTGPGLGGMIGSVLGPTGITAVSRLGPPGAALQAGYQAINFAGRNFGEASIQNYETERRRVQAQSFYEAQQGDVFRQILRDTQTGFTERKLRGQAGAYEIFKDVLASPGDLFTAFSKNVTFEEAREKRVREETESIGLSYSEDVRKVVQRTIARDLASFNAQLGIGVGGTRASYANLARSGLSNREAAFFVEQLARSQGRAATAADAELANAGLGFGFSANLIGSLIRSGGGRQTGNESFSAFAALLGAGGLGEARYQDARALVGGQVSKEIDASGGMLSVTNIGGSILDSIRTATQTAQGMRPSSVLSPLEMQEATRQGLAGRQMFMQQSRDPRSFARQSEMSVLMSMGLNPVEAMRAIELGLNRADVVKGVTRVARERTGKEFSDSYIKEQVSGRMRAVAGLEEGLFGKDFLGLELEGFDKASRYETPAGRAFLGTSISEGKMAVKPEDVEALKKSTTTKKLFDEQQALIDASAVEAINKLPESLETAIVSAFTTGVNELTTSIGNFLQQTAPSVSAQQNFQNAQNAFEAASRRGDVNAEELRQKLLKAKQALDKTQNSTPADKQLSDDFRIPMKRP